MPHIVASHLARGVGEPVRELRRLRIEQEPRRLDRIAGDADHARLLLLQGPALVGVDDAVDLAAGIVVDLDHHAVRSDLEMTGTLRLRDLGVERRPFSADGAAGHAETDLLAGRATVAGLGVNRHVAGVDLGISHALGASRHHLEIVVARETRDVVRAGDAQLVLGARIEELELLQRDRPVEKIGARDIAVDGARAKLVLLEAQRRASPMHRRPANGLADPERQCRVKIASADALVEPAQAAEHGGVVVDDVGDVEPRSRLQTHHIDAALGELVGQRSAARARTDHHDD